MPPGFRPAQSLDIQLPAAAADWPTHHRLLKAASGASDAAASWANSATVPSRLDASSARHTTGWRKSAAAAGVVCRGFAGLKPEASAGVFRSPAGFHVLKLLELRGAGAPGAREQAHVRHILVRTNELVSEDEAKRKLLALRERIVNGVNFAELARLNSDDGSASRGGDLGWVYSRRYRAGIRAGF